jgi:hypothetical protein
MANLDTAIYTAQTTRDTSLYVNQSFRPLQQPLRFARFEYTIPASPGLTAADKLRLGFLNASNAKIVPELSRITSQGTGAAVVVTLKKCDTAGTETSLTAAATLNENSVALARPSALVVPEVEQTDYLFLLLGTVTTETAGTVILVEIAYYSEETH